MNNKQETRRVEIVDEKVEEVEVNDGVVVTKTSTDVEVSFNH